MAEPNAHTLLETLKERGLVAQMTHEQEMGPWLEEKPRTFYIGYDPTADSLHAGHLVTLMAARWLALHGHRALLLVGGGTAQIGDPTGKSEARPVLSAADIARHAECLRTQMARLLPNDAQVETVDNASWLEDVTLLDFLKHTAQHFSVARMLSAETYKARVGSGLSLLEFCYQPLQSLDFSVLCQRNACRLQIGGDDQWSNILGGVELCRRRGQGQTYGLTVPLVTTANGAKMGKTQSGALWLDERKTPPGEFYQYWVNVQDVELARFLKLLTALPVSDIDAIGARPSAELNAAKNILAFEVTAWVHGEAAAIAAHTAALAAFGGRTLPKDLLPTSRVPRDVNARASDMPSHALSLDAPVELSALLVVLGWAKSNNEARRLIAQGAVSLAGEKVVDPHTKIDAPSLGEDGLILKAGKKRIMRLYVPSH